MSARRKVDCVVCGLEMRESDSFACVHCGMDDFCQNCCEEHEDECGFDDDEEEDD